MDYKLIKENFERATAELVKENTKLTEQEKQALEFLNLVINKFKMSEGISSQKLIPLDDSKNRSVMEINTLIEQLDQELEELVTRVNTILDGGPGEADPDTATGESISEEK